MDRKAYEAETKSAWDAAWTEIDAAKHAIWTKYHERIQNAVRTHLDEPNYTSPTALTKYVRPST
jgi:hypothetical protein